MRFFVPFVVFAALAGCSGGGRSLPPTAVKPSSLSPLSAPPRLNQAAPRRPAFIDTVPAAPPALGARAGQRSTSDTTPHPAFFAGENALSNGVFYLTLPNSNIFGYYSYLPDSHYIYHFDLGYEYLIDANDGNGGVYMYDFASTHWWYTSRAYEFPYLYDFTLNAVIYYYPTSDPQHYTASPRYFYNFKTSQVVTIPSAQPAPAVGFLGPASNGSVAGILNNVSSDAIVVGISGAQAKGGAGKFVPTANVNVSFGPTVLSAKRAPRGIDAFAPKALAEMPVEGPEEYRALTRGLQHSSRRADSVRRTRSLGTTVGATNSFWTFTGAIGAGGSSYTQRPATLQVVTPNGYIWIDNTLLSGSAPRVTATIAQAIADDFENAYASDTAHFGTAAYTASSPGMVDGSNPACDATGTSLNSNVTNFVAPTDNKIHVFVVDVQGLGTGVGGYFSSANYFYQTALNCLIGHGATASSVPRSNEAPMFVVGYNKNLSDNFETNEDLVRGTSHELQHEINFVDHIILHDGFVAEDTWINEGMSVLAQDFAVNRKFPAVPIDILDAGGRAHLYLGGPENYSLTAFTGLNSVGDESYNCSGCYGLSYLFQRYLYDRFGGDQYLHKMLSSDATSFDNLAQATGIDTTQAIADFALAIAASGTGATSDPRYGFTGINLRGTYSDQFGASGYTYTGPTTIPLGTQTVQTMLGSFFYLEGGASAAGKTVSANEPSGTYLLRAGVVQR